MFPVLWDQPLGIEDDAVKSERQCAYLLLHSIKEEATSLPQAGPRAVELLGCVIK